MAILGAGDLDSYCQSVVIFVVKNEPILISRDTNCSLNLSASINKVEGFVKSYL
jgi:hypothetical protein